MSAWESLTSDSFILDAIKHYHIEFESAVPYQAQEPRHIYSSLSDKEVIDGEISKLLLKGVIENMPHRKRICIQCVCETQKRWHLPHDPQFEIP